MARTRRLTFDDIGLTGQWADVLDAKFMSYKRLKALRAELGKIIESAGGSDGIQDSDVIERLLCSIVTEWNVLNADDDSPLTGKPTPDVVGLAPLGLLMEIVKALNAATEDLLPKGSGSTN